MLDVPKLHDQLLTLVVKAGGKIDHPSGMHDDWANAAAGALVAAAKKESRLQVVAPIGIYKESHFRGM